MLRDITDSPVQRLLITLLADFEDDFTGAVPSGLLVDIFAEFGISSDAVRTAFSRLVKQGTLERIKTGRSTAYVLSPRSRELVAEASERIMSFGEHVEWDGQWTLVAFSISEGQRNLRYQLRSHLRALGFAPAFDGVWIAAHATVAEAHEAITSAKVSHTMVFRGSLSTEEVTAQQLYSAWNLDNLRDEYLDFIELFAPLRERVASGEVSPAESLIARTKIMDAWRVFPRKDPDLPEQFLPENWPRARAREIFLECYQSLAPTASLRLRMLIDAHDRER